MKSTLYYWLLLISNFFTIHTYTMDIYEAVRDAMLSDNNAAFSLWLTQLTQIDMADDEGRTLLSWAAIHGNKAFILKLINRGVQLNKPNNRGETPLFRAAFRGNVTAVETLLEKGADSNQTDNKGSTPLAIAIEQNHNDIAILLLKANAQVNTSDYKQRTPLYIAAHSNNKVVIPLLINAGADRQAAAKRAQEQGDIIALAALEPFLKESSLLTNLSLLNAKLQSLYTALKS